MPRVFISYRQTNNSQRKRVRAFAKRLRDCGITVILDQFYLDDHSGGPPDGWPKWSSDQAICAEKVIVIGSESWFLCFDGKQKPGNGLGAACEAHELRQRIYDNSGMNEHIRVVLFDDSDAAHISFHLKRFPTSDINLTSQISSDGLKARQRLKESSAPGVLLPSRTISPAPSLFLGGMPNSRRSPTLSPRTHVAGVRSLMAPAGSARPRLPFELPNCFPQADFAASFFSPRRIAN